MLFSAIGFAQIGQAWGLRSLTRTPFRFGPNPALAGLTPAEARTVLGLARGDSAKEVARRSGVALAKPGISC